MEKTGKLRKTAKKPASFILKETLKRLQSVVRFESPVNDGVLKIGAIVSLIKLSRTKRLVLREI